MKRLGIFFFYDDDGVVDKYVDIMIDAFKKFFERLVVVVNGRLNRDGRMLFKKYTTDIIVRPNIEFDVGAYKEAINYLGWDEIRDYDEMIIFNHTFYAPIFPLEEMFAKMDEDMNIEFWGITKHHSYEGVPARLAKYIKDGSGIPEHIQSHFLAIRRELLCDPSLKSFFDNLPPIESYEDSNYYFEIEFTQRFSAIGYSWAVYADSDFLDGRVLYPVLDSPVELLEKTRCPILKRKNFWGNFESYLHKSAGNNAANLLKYVKEHTNYDISLIENNLIRTCSMGELQKFFPLRFVVTNDSNYELSSQIAVVALITKNNAFDEYGYYLESFKYIGTADIFVILDGFDDDYDVNKKLKVYGVKTKLVIKNPDNQNVEKGLAILLSKLSKKYDYVCVIRYSLPGTHRLYNTELASVYINCENLIHSTAHVKNVIKTFEQNRSLGILASPALLAADYTKQIGNVAVGYSDILAALADKYSLKYINNTAVATSGSFWIRTSALDSMCDELIADADSKIFNTKTRLCSLFGAALTLFAHADGYYTGIVYSNEYAENEIKMLNYYLLELCHEVNPNRHIFDVFSDVKKLKTQNLNNK